MCILDQCVVNTFYAVGRDYQIALSSKYSWLGISLCVYIISIYILGYVYIICICVPNEIIKMLRH